MFDYQPILKGDLIRLRPLIKSDFESLYCVANDPVMWQQHPAKDRHKREVFEAFFDQAIQSGGALLAIDVVQDRVIGTSRYHGYDLAKSEIEIGWTFLKRTCWGGVYNREIKKLMLSHAYKFIENVIFIIDKDNIRSQKAVEKIGGVLLPKQEYKDDDTNVAYRLSKNAFENEFH